MNQIAAVLEALDIPVLHLGSLFEREEVRNLLSLMSLAVDNYGNGLINIGSMQRYNLSLQDVYVATRYLRETDKLALAELNNLSKLPGLSDEGIAGLIRLAKDLSGLSASNSPWDYLTNISSR